MPEPRTLSAIAAEIRADWRPIHIYAKSYVEAMASLQTLDDSYGADTAVSVVSYFLSNCSQWRGSVARRVKQELKDMLKAKGVKL